MGLGQTMLTAGFFIVLIIMFMNAYQVLNNADQQLLTANAYKTATDLGQSLMAEILTKHFDQNYNPTSWASGDYDTKNFTDPGSGGTNLGPESGEPVLTSPDVFPFQSIQKWNDIDDYNHYIRLTDSTNGLGRFRDSVLVYYVSTGNFTNPNYPNCVSTSRQNWKRIDLYVTNGQFLPGKWVKLSTLVSYYDH